MQLPTKKPTGRFRRRRMPLAVLVLSAILICVVALWVLYGGPLAPARQNPIARTPSLTALHCAEHLPLATLAGQVLMIGLKADQMAAQAPLFKQYHVGGAVIMTSPDNPYDGSITLFKSRAGSSGDPVLMATDEEGGIVQRFQSLGLLPAPADVAASYTPSQAQNLITAHGQKLKSIGIDMVLGPLADVAPVVGQSPLGNRIFSSNPQTVSSYDAAYVRGWQAAGLIPTLKHFPGLGSATGNTDFQPATTPPLSSLVSRDFIPYKSLASSGTAVMVGNQNVPGWFTGSASLSPVVDKYLRSNLGYKASLIITDSLAANAITSTTSISNAVVESLAAGNDMVIIVSPDASAITTAENRQLIASSVAALEKAVLNGAITKQRLAQAVTRKLQAQNLSACSL